MTRRILPALLLISLFQLHCAVSKNVQDIISSNEVYRIESILSHDSMEGRRALTPGIDKAAAFISSEMKNIGLQTFQSDSYLQPFDVLTTKVSKVEIDMNAIQDKSVEHVIVKSASEKMLINENSGYKIVRIANAEAYNKQVNVLMSSHDNLLVLVDTSASAAFQRTRSRLRGYPSKPNTIVFVLTPFTDATRFSVQIEQAIKAQSTSNIIGLLPGKKKAYEYVIFSAHYDHLGIGRPDEKGDSLYNGANDDASGTTAVLMLAKYFSALKNNDRSILFVAFTAEELGLFGSDHFATGIDANKVVAMFNIEMIGTASKWGNNSAFITGYERSDFASILAKNINGSDFRFYPDPYDQYKLFYRSDNASLAKLGVPAHSISTSQMDHEPFYHKPGDEINTLDLANMTSIIKAIALSSQSIIAGKDTPTRIPPVD